ncbi:hypothetical protein ACOT81_42305 [Streptomyces sp. WI04-05B]|uniref:hypothetical protein n=1 Tax=Streptomyces TaxID=1883 RepID=UPI0029AF601F|nr:MULTISPECIES: hypothetical protein [unclassified Streptomyces]MDX2547829.1 hypothetical protein [Streptomyces sp. WI04-05B]MDX2583067.1 hypothetical protein [Streptomyces sp. WI04-05A]MDX3748599.1 hypothetical protein [Streptomyces sp. AK08-02]
MGLYRTVRHEGLCDDLPRYLDLRRQMWLVLQNRVGRTVRTVWEPAFPGLASRKLLRADADSAESDMSRAGLP